MDDSPIRSREEVRALLDTIIDSRLTPNFLLEVSKPGNLGFLETLVTTAFNRIERKTSLAESRKLG